MKQPGAKGVFTNNVSIRIVGNAVAVFLVPLSILTVTDHIIEQAIIGQSPLSGLGEYFSAFMLLNVLPILVIFGAFLYWYSWPISHAYRRLAGDGPLSPREMALAKTRIFSLPAFVFLLDFISFFAGTLVFLWNRGLFADWSNPRLWFQMIFTLSSSVVYAFVQISLNNQVLTQVRSVMKITSISGQARRREMGLRAKTVLVGTLLAVYAVSYFMPKLMYAWEVEAAALESVVNTGGTDARASEAFAARFAHLDPAPDFQHIVSAEESRRAAVRSTLFIGFGAIILIVLAVIATYAREITLQIRLQQDKIRGILDGNDRLTERLNITAYDEVGLLSELINQFMATLEDILNSISDGSIRISNSSTIMDIAAEQASAAMHEVVSSVRQITSSAEEQSGSVELVRHLVEDMQTDMERARQDIENQSSFIEQTAGAMSEMAGNIASVARSTEAANELGKKLRATAESGEQQLAGSIDSIRAIRESTTKVSEFVQVIADVADRTNLLAMNAAIEAAHAGEAGRGFAVVASEIRKLAESSSAQSRQIFEHIRQMTERVENGVAATEEAGSSFRRIFRGIDETAQLIDQVSSAMGEQRAGTDEVLASVSTVVDSTNTLKELMGSVRLKSQHIENAMADLIQMAEYIRGATREQHRSNEEISAMLVDLRKTSEANTSVSQALEGICGRFSLEEE
jgi:methyl-accepting chemotaxis protein